MLIEYCALWKVRPIILLISVNVMGQEFENSMSHFLLLLSNRPKKTRCHKDKRHPTSKSDASFCLSHKVFLDKFSPWQHLFLKIRVDKARNSV